MLSEKWIKISVEILGIKIIDMSVCVAMIRHLIQIIPNDNKNSI